MNAPVLAVDNPKGAHLACLPNFCCVKCVMYDIQNRLMCALIMRCASVKCIMRCAFKCCLTSCAVSLLLVSLQRCVARAQCMYSFVCFNRVPLQTDRNKVARFTSINKEMYQGPACIMITTYNMLAYNGDRNAASNTVSMARSSKVRGTSSVGGDCAWMMPHESCMRTCVCVCVCLQMMEHICSREWGLLLMDEVHVVPADMFRKVSVTSLSTVAAC